MISLTSYLSTFFFFNDTATTEIYTLSLHDALPILRRLTRPRYGEVDPVQVAAVVERHADDVGSGADAEGASSDRKSTRLNSSHTVISYAVFCLKKKKNKTTLSSLIPVP